PVQRAGEQRVLALDAEGARPLEPAPGARRPDARDPREPAVEHAVDHDEPAAAERLEREAVGDPRREPDDGVDGGLVRRADRDRAAHREPEQERPLGTGLAHGRARVLDAPAEPLPGLDPVLDLREAELGEAWRQPADEPLDGRAR